MPDTVLVKYIANADPRDGTEIIRLADAKDGTSRELKRGGPAVEVTAAEVAVLAQGFEIKVAREGGTFEEDDEGAGGTTAPAPTESSAPSAPAASTETDTSASTPVPTPAPEPEPEPTAAPATTATPSGPETGSSGTEPDAGTTPSTTPGTLGR